ncbi:MAG: SIMPL domain-containing protein [Burkholderiaceae bacterium]
MRFRCICPTAALLTALATPLAHAEEVLQGVVSLSTSASVEVTKDVLSVTFSTTREGGDATGVQSQLKQALAAAVAEAKKVAQPGQLEVQTGNFSLAPRYTTKGAISGWQGSAELIVEGRDMQAIGQLSGRITTLSINRVGYKLSREASEQAEAEISAQAIARYRAKAADYARQFGYADYTVLQVNVNTSTPPVGRPVVLMQARAMASAPEEALSVEPGQGTVSVNVSGTVQMLK